MIVANVVGMAINLNLFKSVQFFRFQNYNTLNTRTLGILTLFMLLAMILLKITCRNLTPQIYF